MRYLVELRSDGPGRIGGLVIPAGGPPVPFSGWLDLLRILEDAVQGDVPEPGHDVDRGGTT